MTERRAQRYGRLGGKKKAAEMSAEQRTAHAIRMNQGRTVKLSPERRSEIARLAARARHAKRRKPSD